MKIPHLKVLCGIIDTIACESEFSNFKYLDISEGIAIATYSSTEESNTLKANYDENPLNNNLIIQVFNTKFPIANTPENNENVNVAFILKSISSICENGHLLSKETLDLRFNSASITQIVLPDLVSSHLSLLEIKNTQEKITQLYLCTWAYQLAYSITETLGYLFESDLPSKFKKIDIQKIKWLEYSLKSNLHKPNPTIIDMSKTAVMSPTKFKTIFKEVFGMSPHRYILNLKIKHAKYLLNHQNTPDSKLVA